MRNSSSLIYSVLLVVGDMVALLAAFTAAYIARVHIDDRQIFNPIPAEDFIVVLILLLPVWILIFSFLGLYSQNVYEKKLREFSRLAIGSFLGILVVIGYDFITIDPVFPAKLVAVWGLLASFSFLVLERIFLWNFRKSAFRYGVWTNNLMIIGSNKSATALANLLGHTETSGYSIRAMVGSKSVVPAAFADKHYSNLDQALKKVDSLGVNTIIQTELYESFDRNDRILQTAQQSHISYKFVPTHSELYSAKNTVELFHGYPVLAVHPTPLIGWGRVIKRLTDFSVSLLLVILLSPVYVIVALLILLFDFGPITYSAKRMTRWGQETKITKFRTLKKKYSGMDPAKAFKKLGQPELINEYESNRAKVDDDPRISKLGKFLRATSIDELPQLFNVLGGGISLVGPRAIPKNEAEKDLREKTPIILSVKTGITGLAQTSGRSDLTLEDRIKLDEFYVQNWSVFLDIKIMLKTIGVVLNLKGAK